MYLDVSLHIIYINSKADRPFFRKVFQMTKTNKTPRSWKEAEGHPNIDEIIPEFHDEAWKYYIMIPDNVHNPVTEQKGGAFFVENFRDLQQSLNWEIAQ